MKIVFALMLRMAFSGFLHTPANICDSQMLPMLLDPENQDDYVWADSAYSGERFKDLPSLGGFKNRIHETESRNHPLSAAATERNSIRSQIRARVEHVFGFCTTSMGGKFTRRIGLKRNKAWWSLKDLTLISCATYIIQAFHWSAFNYLLILLKL